jgi:hypothetical protein
MTTAANAIWLNDPKAYQDKLCGLLGDRDPIGVLSRTAEVLDEFVKKNPVQKLQTRPFPGKWTPNEIFGHLVDTEWTFGFRMRMIFCEEEPTILGMDQEKWVERQRYNQQDPRELVGLFRALRGGNLALWKTMTPTDLARVGRHNERGAESLGMMLRMEAGHDLSHIDQITRYLQAIG